MIYCKKIKLFFNNHESLPILPSEENLKGKNWSVLTHDQKLDLPKDFIVGNWAQ